VDEQIVVLQQRSRSNQGLDSGEGRGRTDRSEGAAHLDGLPHMQRCF
jgi:hypothetical protein